MKARFVISLFLLIPLALAACGAPPAAIPERVVETVVVDKEGRTEVLIPPAVTEAPAYAELGATAAPPEVRSHKTPSWDCRTQPRDG